MKIIFISLLFYFIGIFFLRRLIPALTIYLPDIPNKRSSHKEIKPRGGGSVFIILSILSTFLHGNFSYLLSLPLSFISLIDDKYNISSKIRFLVQLVSSYCIVIYSPFGRLSTDLFNNKFDSIFRIFIIQVVLVI